MRTRRSPDLRSAAGRTRRLPARPGALLLSLVARSTRLWLGWLQARWAAVRAAVLAWRSARAQAQSAAAALRNAQGARLETLEPKLLLSADLMPLDLVGPPATFRNVDVPAAEPLAVRVADAVAVADVRVAPAVTAPVVTITGPGSGQLVAQGAGYVLQLTGTSNQSSVSIASSTQVLLTGISANSAVGSLGLANADLQGSATFSASVNTLTLGKVQSAVISIGAGTDFSMKAASIVDSRVVAAGVNVSVATTTWSTTTAGASRIEAAGLKTLTLSGNFSADVFLSGMASGYTLGVVEIGGAITAGLWSVHGRANAFSVGSTTAAWRMNISSTLVQLVTKGDIAGTVALGGLQLLQVGGSMNALTLLVGANLGDDAALGGSGANADTFGVGTLTRLRVGGDVVDSSLLVSVDPVDGVFSDGNDRQLGTVVQRIQELTVGGQLLGRTSIDAPAFPARVRIGGVSVDPATVPQLGSIPPDRTPPVILSLALDPASDTGLPGDNLTLNTVVGLIGRTEAGAVLSLRRTGTTTVIASTSAALDGSFRFTGIGLSLGANGFEVVAQDAAGNASAPTTLVVTREAVPDTQAPTLSAALVNDTGSSAGDGLTRDASISGTAKDDVGVAQLLVTLDPVAGSTATDLVSLVQADGSFVINRAALDTLAGGTLAQGAHSVRIVALDAAGNAITRTVGFTLDTLAPSGAAFAISTLDAYNGNDAQTAAALVTLKGSAEAGATITLVSQSLSSTASGSGGFQLPGVALAVGDTTLTLQITDAAGNSQTVTRTLTRVAVAQSDAVLDWITVALKAIQLDVTDPAIATRVLAIQSVAVYDSLAAIQGTPAYLVQRSVTGDVNAQAAAAQAAYRVLYTLYPGQRASLAAALATSLGAITDGAAKTAGIALGDSIAQAVLAIRASDGYLDFVADDGSTAVGQWRPTGPMYLVAQDPQWADVTPFALTAPDEFRADAPPSLDSAAYAAALNQVKDLGSATSTTRTADQTQQAQFWADGGGSYTPPGHWNQIAAQVAAAQGQSLSANARLMAQLNVALADAAIACWDTKYTYDLWRPVTAIQNADLDGNAATTQDANWTPLLITPPHPTYVSGHSTFSAAAAGILAATFGDNTAFSTTSATLTGVTRSYTSFSQAADEAGVSRIYGGIHTSIDNAAGKTIGTEVAQAVLAKFALTQDTQAPSVVLNTTPAATNANPTFAGQVLDNLSGVASARYSIDGGTAQVLTLDGSGHFSFSTSLALDGTADGSHTITITATDAAGNVSTALSRSFTLDTQAPSVTLSSIASGDALTAATRLTGTAAPNGSSLASLSYQIDGGTAKSLIFDASTGSFDQALTLGDLGIGDHTVTLTARDSAGNTTALTRAVKLEQLALFTIKKLTPTDGSADVGVTYRPQVFFSRAVNPATLTADSFYATGPDGAKVAATIVPALDGSFAWLFFTNPMPGGSNVTLHLKGSSIRAAGDGSFLDADGDGTAGGDLAWSFTTVSTTSVLGAKLSGKVVDPGADLQPMTFDDIRRGPDGVIHTADDIFLNPIANARVSIIGRPDLVTYTDAQGNFSFDNVPVGNVKVAIDGRTATNSPTGVFWPEMVMDATLRPGITNTLMGSMGSSESQQENATRQEVYLPRVQTSALQTISNTASTTVTVDEKSAPDLTDDQRGQLKLVVAPGSAVGSDGKVLTDVKIGINTVPPELVKDMLPAGVLQHTFDITIQAPGVDTFTSPVQITFPNVFNAEPGTKLNILSFDHTTGRLVINGTGTVSQDGLTVVSDEGSGVLAPGWHGLTPAGGPIKGPAPPPPPPCADEPDSNPLDNIKFWSDTLADILECAKQFSKVLNTISIVYTIINDSLGLVTELVSFIQTAKQAVANHESAQVILGLAKVAQTYKDRIVKIVELSTEAIENTAGIWINIVECIGPALSIADRVCEDLANDPCEEISVFGAYACVGIDTAKRSFDAAKLLYDRFTGDLKSLVSLKAACFITENLIDLLDQYLSPPNGPSTTNTSNSAANTQRFSALAQLSKM